MRVIGLLLGVVRKQTSGEQFAEQLNEALLLCGVQLSPELARGNSRWCRSNQRGGSGRSEESDMVARQFVPDDVVGTIVPTPATPPR